MRVNSGHEKLNELLKYPYFQHVGNLLPDHVKAVATWEIAADQCRSINWQRNCVMARNTLQHFVEVRNWPRSEQWNQLVDTLRSRIESFVEELRPRPAESSSVFELIRHNLVWCLLGICFKQEYSDVVKPLFFIPYVEEWYRSGHFPCGWDGTPLPDAWNGVMPQGRLIVF